jgi:hypothetical protein
MSSKVKPPIVSGLLTAGGLMSIFAMATATNNDILGAAAAYYVFTSPAINLVNTGIGVFNAAKSTRSKLSRAFNGVAAGIGAAGTSLIFMMNDGINDGFAALALGTFFATASAGTNLAAHYINKRSLDNKPDGPN